ncbi:hypothetical protein BC831DRAFT_395896 [Entophlyctis helioformis]|nr:hypothetical protein BC831DRAFT_395896 [Entophlyctis helioformis]
MAAGAATAGHQHHRHQQQHSDADAQKQQQAADKQAADKQAEKDRKKAEREKQLAKQKEDDAVVCNKRLYLGGLASDVSTKDIAGRFASFGKVAKVELQDKQAADGTRYAYVTLETTPASLKKCKCRMSIYNGTKWKGHALKIDEAKQHYLAK